MAKDYYSILGVKRDASVSDIKQAFRRLAHEHHPDKPGGNAERFKEINEAYQVLNDPKRREEYDRFGTTSSSGAGMNWQDFQRSGGFDFRSAGVDFGDLGDVFGDMFGFGRSRQAARQKGSDAEVELSVDFREAVFGTEKLLEVAGPHVCDRCNGRGGEPGSALTQCSTCHGSGVVESVQQTILGGIRTRTACPNCGGSGEKPKTNCKRCHGTGATRTKRQLRVAIPAGIDDNQSIRLKGQGEPGGRGAQAGDLFVRIRVRPDPMFRREGEDILTRRSITFTQAALGAQIPVETLDGEVQLEVPGGTQSGKLFRLREKGVPRLDGRGRGDQIVEVVVKIPTKLSRKQHQLLEQLAEIEDEHGPG